MAFFSLSPLDVGFDLRVTKHPIHLPSDVTTVAYLDMNNDLQIIEGTLSDIKQVLPIYGYVIAEMIDSRTIPALGEYEYVQKTTIDNPHLWDIDDPYLYKVYNIVKEDDKIVDVTETTFGIRSFYFDANKGFFLNGRHVKLKGFNAIR